MHGNQKQGLHALSYIGGLIDGEGSIMITKCKNNRVTPYYTARIKISMTDIEPLEFIVNQTGYGKIKREVARKDKDKCHRKVIHLWHIYTKKECMEFAEMISPYLLIKKEQALLVVEFYKNRKIMKNRKAIVDLEESTYREDMYNKMHKLNMRNQLQRLSPEASREDAIV
jgi:hypothetical protein